MTPDSLALRRTAAKEGVAWNVYADWLDEHGRPEEAELVRVYLALEKGPEPGEFWCKTPLPDGICRGCRLRAREKELLELGKVHSQVKRLLGG
jgi:uncharacterized protein (TIGR02996 family)